jgi:hypothetical protein
VVFADSVGLDIKTIHLNLKGEIMTKERLRKLKTLQEQRHNQWRPTHHDGHAFEVNLPIDKTLLLLQLAEEVFLRDMEIRAYDEHEIALLEIIQDLEELLDVIAPKGRFFGSHSEHHEATLPFGYWPQKEADKALPVVRKIAEVEEQSANA